MIFLSKTTKIVQILGVGVSGSAIAATTLSPGDISIIGYSADGVDQFSFVTWVDLDGGTEISFTDRGWRNGAGEFTKNPSEEPGSTLAPADGNAIWSTSVAVSAGSVITATLQNNNPDTLLWSLGVSTGDFGFTGLTSGGESIFAYQGAASSPDLIFGLYFDDTSWGTSDPGEFSTGASELPAALNNPISNIVVPTSTTNDNGFFNGDFSGEVDLLDYRAQVLNNANWTVSNADTVDDLASQFSGTQFVVVPEPGSSCLLALSGLVCLVRRRR